MGLIPKLTDGGRGLLISALSGSPLNFTKLKIGNGAAPEEPNDGDYWYDTGNLTLYRYSKRWDESLRNITVSDTEPSDPTEDDLWYNTETGILNCYSKGWKASSATITCASAAPNAPSVGDYWYDTANTTLYVYGNKWNADSSIHITAASVAPNSPSAGDYWYDTANSKLKVYVAVWGEKTGVTLTCAGSAPDSPTAGDYWYDTTAEKLKKYGIGWRAKSDITLTCAGSAPDSPTAGDYWYDTTAEALKKYAAAWRAKSDVTITCAASAPESPADGDYWYDTENSALKVYDDSQSDWVASAQPITYSGSEPSGTPTLGDWWYDSTNSALKEYANGWDSDAQPFTYGSTEPSSPTSGDWWYDTANSALKSYADGWDEDAQPFSYGSTAPVSPTLADWWYDTSSSTLKEYALAWQDDTTHTFTYGSAPTNPSIGDWWFDTSLHVYGYGWNADSSKNFTYSSSAPANPQAGYWWYDSANNALKEYGLLFQKDNEDTFTYAATAPVRANEDDLWYDTTESKLKIWATGWVEDTEKTFTYSQSAPVSPIAGDWWFDTESRVLFEYNGTTWAQSSTTISCSASPPATQDTLEDLVNPLIEIDISGFSKGSNYVSLTGAFDNTDVASTFNWSETGVFAEDEDGNEVLYAYCYTGDDYETIPANNLGRTIHITLTVLVMIGDAQEVTATIGEGSIYITKEQFESHAKDYENPHNVTKEQIGLGNVENVAPEDMAIEYTIASSLAEPESGEKMDTFLGKVKRAINNLILHLQASNPHGITPSKIGAAATSHRHNATDITGGVLPVSRGGTGASSLEALAASLAPVIGSGTAVFGTYTGDGTTKRTISLGFTPSALIVVDGRGRMTDKDIVYGGLCVGNKGVRIVSCTAVSHETTWSNSHTALLITSGGFFCSEYSSTGVKTNTSSETYRFIAFR